MEHKIAIVNSSSFGTRFPSHLERLKKLGEVERVRVAGDLCGKPLADALADFDIVIASVTPFFDAEFFSHKSDLKLLSRHGIGYNNVDLQAARACGCIVTTVEPQVERDAVAECAVGCLMALMRKIPASNTAANDGRWADRAQFVGHGLTGKTLGVIGCGNIGSRVAEIMGRGFDMRVLAYDPVPRKEWAHKFNVKYVTIEELLEQSHVISLNANLTPESSHILNTKHLALCKQGMYVVDTARADLIDQEAMLEALATERVAGLAIDVMHDEPPQADDPYFNHPKVIVTTHIAAYTAECLEGMGDKCTTDVERFCAGLPPIHAKVG